MVLTVSVGCTTTGSFNIPEGTDLYINNRSEPVEVNLDGTVTTKPYGWNTVAEGVPYRLEQNGQTVKQGKLRTKFRPVSIFWPPVALAYWPVGLVPDITYDLEKDTQD
jgi:hypothetical protein